MSSGAPTGPADGRPRPDGPLLPGGTVGVVGGGQLGRMLGQAALRMGYRFAVWSEVPGAPALALAHTAVVAPYDDAPAFERFVAAAQVVTVEFENLPLATLKAIAARRPLSPSPELIEATQHRGREKAALAALGLPLPPHRAVNAARELAPALAAVGRPAVLKTAGFGYDGKGQVRIPAMGDVPAEALALAADQPCVLEAFVDLAAELSVVVARGRDGQTRAFPPFENHHRHHVLDLTVVPARVSTAVADQAVALAARVADGLDLVGLACVEFFLDRDGRLWLNEVAPRPHNSGHVSIEACSVDQFEQQLRAVCGLPLGDPSLVTPGAMVNLLGDLWAKGEPDWAAAMARHPEVRVHLYGKGEARAGRKMGHLSAVATSADAAVASVVSARQALREDPVTY